MHGPRGTPRALCCDGTSRVAAETRSLSSSRIRARPRGVVPPGHGAGVTAGRSVLVRWRGAGGGAGDEVGVLGVAVDVAGDERAAGDDLEAGVAGGVEGGAGESAAEAAALELGLDLGVAEDDGAALEDVVGEADDRAVEPHLEAGRRHVVGDLDGLGHDPGYFFASGPPGLPPVFSAAPCLAAFSSRSRSASCGTWIFEICLFIDLISRYRAKPIAATTRKPSSPGLTWVVSKLVVFTPPVCHPRPVVPPPVAAVAVTRVSHGVTRCHTRHAVTAGAPSPEPRRDPGLPNPGVQEQAGATSSARMPANRSSSGISVSTRDRA